MDKANISELEFEDLQKVYSNTSELVDDARMDLNEIIKRAKAKAGILSLYDIVQHKFIPELFVDNDGNDFNYSLLQTKRPLIGIDKYQVIKEFSRFRKDLLEFISSQNIKTVFCFPIFVVRTIDHKRIGEIVLFSESDDILISEKQSFRLCLERLLLKTRTCYLNGRMNRRKKQLDTVMNYAKKIENCDNIKDILKAVDEIGFKGYKDIYGLDSGFIIRLLENGKLKAFNYYEGVSLFEKYIDANEPLFKKVLESKKSIVIDDPQNYPDFKRLVDEVKDQKQYEFRKSVTSLIITPFLVANIPKGIFVLYERKGLLGVSEKNFLEILSLMTSLAYKNVEAYEKAEKKVRQKVKRIELLHDLTKKIIAEPNVEQLLNTILNSGLKLVGAQGGNIRKYNKETSILTRVVSTKHPLDGDIEKIVSGKGICGMVAKSGIAMKADDACSKEYWREILIDKFGETEFNRKIKEKELMRSEISAPLIVSGEIIGTIDAHMLEPCAFTYEDLEIFKDLSNLSAIVLKRQELSNRLAMVRSISDFYYSGITNQNLNDLLKKSISNILNIIGITKGAIALEEIKDGISQLKFVCVNGIPGLKENSFRKIGMGIIGKAAAESRLINIDDVNDVFDEHLEIDKNIKSECIAPLIFDHKLKGIIMVASKIKERFDADDKLLLKTIANQIAILVHNVQLLEEKEQNFKTMENETIHNMINMSGMMAHQIKNPLMMIQAATKNIEKKIERGIYELSGHLESIDHGIRSASQIIDKVQTFVKIQGRELDFFNIHELLDDSLEVIKGIKQSDHITLIKNYTKSISEITFNRFEMAQVFMNIFNNAYEAMRNKGDTLTITTNKHENMFRIDVEDNGEGIPKEIGNKIFISFFTTKNDGTGLGLAISKRFIDNHHGEIMFNSVEGKGTKFSIYLPLDQGE